MTDIAQWLPPLCVGLLFTLMGGAKLYGLRRGAVGGGGKPFTERLCGT
jgi:hypothetical protein